MAKSNIDLYEGISKRKVIPQIGPLSIFQIKYICHAYFWLGKVKERLEGPWTDSIPLGQGSAVAKKGGALYKLDQFGSNKLFFLFFRFSLKVIIHIIYGLWFTLCQVKKNKISSKRIVEIREVKMIAGMCKIT